MRILMLGNSFTYYHDMPQMLAALLQAEVVSITKGGARLKEHLQKGTELQGRTEEALLQSKWDFVILQEQSSAPIREKEDFQKSADKLCEMIRANGAEPVFYATWAYRDGTDKLASVKMTYNEMDSGLHQSYHEAARRNGAKTADVGQAFTQMRTLAMLYEEDNFHPSEAGSLLAACILAETIRDGKRK